MKIGQSAEHISELHNHLIQNDFYCPSYFRHQIQNQDGSLGCNGHGNDIYQDKSVDCKHSS